MRGKAPEMVASAASARRTHAAELGLVGDQVPSGGGQFFGGMHNDGAAIANERVIGVAEILPVRPRQHDGALAHGLDWVLPAAIDQGAADEGHGREFVERAQLADRVGDVCLAAAIRQIPSDRCAT